MVCIVTEESYYILRYDPQAVVAAITNKDLMSEDGIEDAFDVKFLIFFLKKLHVVIESIWENSLAKFE